MVVGIHYTGNKIGLATLLVQLQPQLSKYDDIYIVDSTKDKSGLAIARLYGTTRGFVMVEVGKYTSIEARDLVFEFLVENEHIGMLIISDRCVISSTFISNLKKAAILGYSSVVPKIVELPADRMDSNFKWFNPVVKSLTKAKNVTDFCYYITYNYTHLETAEFSEETVVVLPNKSIQKTL